MAKLKIGIIGVGGIAQSAHIPGYKAAGDQVELVACADVNYERAKQVAESFGFRRAYQDYREMLEKEELDAVSVCTPNKFHAGDHRRAGGGMPRPLVKNPRR